MRESRRGPARVLAAVVVILVAKHWRFLCWTSPPPSSLLPERSSSWDWSPDLHHLISRRIRDGNIPLLRASAAESTRRIPGTPSSHALCLLEPPVVAQSAHRPRVTRANVYRSPLSHPTSTSTPSLNPPSSAPRAVLLLSSTCSDFLSTVPWTRPTATSSFRLD